MVALGFQVPSGLRKQDPGPSPLGDGPSSGNAVQDGSGPATVRGATRVATDVQRATGEIREGGHRAPSQETCPKVPSQKRRRSILASWNGRMGESGDISFRLRCRDFEEVVSASIGKTNPVHGFAVPGGDCLRNR